MRSSVQISSPHSAYSAHKAFAICLWSRISMLRCSSNCHFLGTIIRARFIFAATNARAQNRPGQITFEKTDPMAHALQESTWQHENPTKSATNSASSANFFSKYQLMRMKYMEVPADAAVLLHDHHSLQFDCRESYVLLGFTNLIILVAGNPTGGLHVTSSTVFKR